jgi:hypothetical protein
MSDRAKDFMSKIWNERNSGADTEEQLVSVILKLAAEEVKFYNSQNGIVVLDKQDLISLADELCDD